MCNLDSAGVVPQCPRSLDVRSGFGSAGATRRTGYEPQSAVKLVPSAIGNWLIITPRRGGRAVESGGLENR